jgi:hypothetical protein
MWRTVAKLAGPLRFSDAALVFAVDDIEHPMETVFDPPMLAGGAGELGGVRGDRGDVEAGLAGSRLAGLLALGLDHGDAGEVGPSGMALLQPSDVADDPVAAGLDAAMIGVGGLICVRDRRVGGVDAKTLRHGGWQP